MNTFTIIVELQLIVFEKEWHMSKFYKWHKTQVYKFINLLNISEYQAMWMAFIKGILITLLLIWIFWTKQAFHNLQQV